VPSRGSAAVSRQDATLPVDAAADALLFDRDTRAIFWNNHQAAIQRMLDYDTLIGRTQPSVAAIVSPTGSSRFGKFFFGTSEVLLPIYKSKHAAASALS
jgi:ATP-citrate lyase alpha-subunit